MRYILFSILLVLSGQPSAGDTKAETFEFGHFGIVSIYRQSPHPSQVVLFVSGDGGWNLGVVDMARELSSLDALVIGINAVHYLKGIEGGGEKCSYPAADFEELSKFVQKKLDFPNYIMPTLAGYSSGATLVYAVLVQSPPNTFRGAISLGFCPDLPLAKPLCRGNGLEWKPGPGGKGYSFLPAGNLSAPWIALQGNIDQVCEASAAEVFGQAVKNGQVVLLPKVGHGFSVPRNWMPQFKEAFTRLSIENKVPLFSPISELKDLPLVEVPAREPVTDEFAVIVTGDGGWAGIDREVGNALAEKGIAIVGLDSLHYFWTPRNPDGSAKDLERILRYYLNKWNKKKVILIGYSLGADVLPLMVNRLSGEMLARVSLLALLGPGNEAEFEFHLTDWLGMSSAGKSFPIFPEVEKLKGKKILCLFGKEESDSLCPKLSPGLAQIIPLAGAHHFGGDYQDIAERIIKELK
ncbi:MAG: virulence factor family protein [bacterium]|nr:virulence factor family protein [bacterium]